MAPLEFDQDFEVVPGESVRLSPLIRRVLCDNPGPFTFKGTSTFIVGNGNVCVIDPGPNNGVHFSGLLEALQNETVTHILITHTHADHSRLAKKLKAETGAKTYAYGPHGAGRAELGPRADASADLEFAPDILLRHGEEISGQGWTIEAVFTPGHASNHMSYTLREEKALFCGDHIMAWATSVIVPPDGHMGDYMNSLRLLLDRDDDMYYPTHGPSPRQPKRLVRAYIAHRRMREAGIVERLAKGDRTIDQIVRTNYPDLDPRLAGAAALSTLAHLQYLIEQGRVVAEGAPTLDAEYRVNRRAQAPGNL